MSAKQTYFQFVMPIVFMSESFLKIIGGIRNGTCNIDKTFPDKLFNKTPEADVKFSIEGLKNFKIFESGDFDEYCRMMKTLSDFVGNCNNTILFRNFKTDKGREVCYINKNIPEDIVAEIKQHFSTVKYLLKRMTPSLRFMRNLRSVLGIYEVRSTSTVIKADISSFFKSVRFENVMQYAPKAFKKENIHLYAKSELVNNDSRMYERLEVALWAFLSCLFHNGVVPTGAQYANNLANFHLYNVLFINFDRGLRSGTKATVSVYVDDLMFTGEEGDVKAVFAEFEKAINKGGLYLNYKKTQYFYPDENKVEFSLLGYRRNANSRGVVQAKVNSKIRKKCLDIIKERREYTLSEKGLINYALRMYHNGHTVFNPDIVLHSYFDEKVEMWNKLVSGELRLKINKEIFDPTGLSYKDICIMAKEVPGALPVVEERRGLPDEMAMFISMFVGNNPSGYTINSMAACTFNNAPAISVVFVNEREKKRNRYISGFFTFDQRLLASLYWAE